MTIQDLNAYREIYKRALISDRRSEVTNVGNIQRFTNKPVIYLHFVFQSASIYVSADSLVVADYILVDKCVMFSVLL